MNFGFIHQAQQSLGSPALPGCWKLGAGQALALNPRQDAVLKVAHGRMWVTLGHAPTGAGDESGDVFLAVGEQITIEAGTSAVIEASGSESGAPVYFSWDPMPAVVRSTVRPALQWQVGVVQPLADLRQAGSLAATAMVRLAAGLVRLALPRPLSLRV